LKEITGDLFDHIGYVDAICITTNGFVKKDGCCVMGRGCAKEATVRYPMIEMILGDRIKNFGNVPHALEQDNNTWICSFPVKPVSAVFNGANAVGHMKHRFTPGETIPGWACLADIKIIKQSALFLAGQVDRLMWEEVVIPRPGCGAGELAWEDVKPVLERYFDDRFSIITWSK